MFRPSYGRTSPCYTIFIKLAELISRVYIKAFNFEVLVESEWSTESPTTICLIGPECCAVFFYYIGPDTFVASKLDFLLNKYLCVLLKQSDVAPWSSFLLESALLRSQTSSIMFTVCSVQLLFVVHSAFLQVAKSDNTNGFCNSLIPIDSLHALSVFLGNTTYHSALCSCLLRTAKQLSFLHRCSLAAPCLAALECFSALLKLVSFHVVSTQGIHIDL